MARYRKISTCIHGDDKVRQLSRPKRANARDLWFYLLTGPHTTSLPGLFRAGIVQLADENGWKPRATSIVFDEILSLAMAKYDSKARVIWLPKAITHNAPESPNVVRSWRPHFDELPDTPLKVEALATFRAFLEEYEAAHPSKKPEQSRLAAFREVFPEAFGEAMRQYCLNQEQEQELKTCASGKPSEKPDAIGAVWESWRSANAALHRTLPLTPTARDYDYCRQFVERYPDPEWRATILDVFLKTDYKGITEKPRTLGFLLHWATWIDEQLRAKGRRPRSEAA